MVTISDHEFRQLAEYIKANYGIHLKDEKKVLVMGRLQKVLQDTGCKSFSEYYEYLTSDGSGQAVITMVNKITTNHTFFMREAEHFTYFKNYVLPYLKESVNSKSGVQQAQREKSLIHWQLSWMSFWAGIKFIGTAGFWQPTFLNRHLCKQSKGFTAVKGLKQSLSIGSCIILNRSTEIIGRLLTN